MAKVVKKNAWQKKKRAKKKQKKKKEILKAGVDTVAIPAVTARSANGSEAQISS